MEQEESKKLRCNLYLPTHLVEEVDKLAKIYGAPRNVMISFMLKSYLDQQEMVELAKMAKLANLEPKDSNV